VQELDSMIVKLIRTRYNDLNDYKQRVLTKSNLPSYVESLIYDNDFLSNPRNHNIFIGLINDAQFQKKLRDLSNLNLNNYKLATSTPALTSSLLNTFIVNQNGFMDSNNNNNNSNYQSAGPIDHNATMNHRNSSSSNNNNASFRQNENYHHPNLNNISNINNTSIYMKRLEKVRINKDLDHNDFDLNGGDNYVDIELESQQLPNGHQSLATAAAAPMTFIDEQDEEVIELNSKFAPLSSVNLAMANLSVQNNNGGSSNGVNSGRGSTSSRDMYSPTATRTTAMSIIKSPVSMLTPRNGRVKFQFSPRGAAGAAEVVERPSSSVSNQTASSGVSGSGSGQQKFHNGYYNNSNQVMDEQFCAPSNNGYHSNMGNQTQMLSPGGCNNGMYSATAIINTPRTPSILQNNGLPSKSQYSQAAESLWGSSSNQYDKQMKLPQNLTPPPSAVSTQNKLSMFNPNDTSSNDSQFPMLNTTRGCNVNTTNSSVNQFEQANYSKSFSFLVLALGQTQSNSVQVFGILTFYLNIFFGYI
jgi:hypothetical protein